MTTVIWDADPLFVLSGMAHEELDFNPYPHFPRACPECQEGSVAGVMWYQIETLMKPGVRGYCYGGHLFDVEVPTGRLSLKEQS